MKLQGRILTIETHGEDVALLHQELMQLDSPIPGDEVERKYFGPGTRKAVLEFQSRYPDEDIGGG